MHHIQVPMHTPAPLVTRTILVTARTGFRVILCLRDNPAFKPRPGRHELKNRRRRINARNRAVRQRTHRIKRHMRPALVAFTTLQGKDIRVQTRRRNHREDFTIARVQSHQGPLYRIRNRRLGRLLQLQVYRRNHVQPRFRRNKAPHIRKRTHFTPRGVHLHKLEAVLASELLVVFLLKPLLPHAVALRICRIFRELQLFFRNFTRVAEHMRSERPVRVFSARFDDHRNARQFRRMLFNYRDLFHRRIFQNTDRACTHPANPLERRIKRQGIEQPHSSRITDIQELSENGIPVRLLARHFKRLERNLVRRAVAHQHIPVAVVNVASVGNQLDAAQAVIFGTLEVLFVMQVLQRKQPKQDYRKKNYSPGKEYQDIPVSADSGLILRSIVIHPTSSPK